MNKRGHVINAILLSVGLGFVLEPGASEATFVSVAEVTVPVFIGALVPDVDTAFGTHRKTMHNLPLLGIVLAYPVYFGNLHWVWVGVVTHYVLDVLGTQRGIALFYPLSRREFGLPVGVAVDSPWATPVTLAVTAVELAGVVLVVWGLQVVGLPALPVDVPGGLA